MKTTRRSFIGKALGAAVLAKFAPELLAQTPPGEVLGILRRGAVSFPMNKGTWICSGQYVPELDRALFDTTTYRGAGESSETR